MLPLFVTAFQACVLEQRTFVQTLPAEGVTDVFADSDRGSLLYSGSNPGEFAVEASPWARRAGSKAAVDALGTVLWGATVDNARFEVWGRFQEANSGVDFVIEGPPTVDVEAILLDGIIELHDVVGRHILTANGIVGRGLIGDLDLYATESGVNVEVFPEDGNTILIQSWGDTVLSLPYGVDVDLEVFSDPDWGVEVTNLGFDEVLIAPDYVSAFSGSGAVRVEVVVIGGGFALHEASDSALGREAMP